MRAMENKKEPYPIEVNYSLIHGRGVFATRDIKKGDIIEECPVLVMNKPNLDLFNYVFKWRLKSGIYYPQSL